MPETVDTPRVATRPKWFLTQNRELKAIGVWNWTLVRHEVLPHLAGMKGPRSRAVAAAWDS